MDAAPQLLVVFTLNERRYALRLAAVERIVLIVAITPLPKAPEIVLGVVDIQGRIVPVVDIRKRFRLPARQARLSDHLIIACTCKRAVALMVDEVAGVVARPHGEQTAADQILPHLQYLEGVMKLEDGLILIHDLDTFLSPVEEQQLERVMAPRGNAA
jgi:purine-binding chemotaxis protein CheW